MALPMNRKDTRAIRTVNRVIFIARPPFILVSRRVCTMALRIPQPYLTKPL